MECAYNQKENACQKQTTVGVQCASGLRRLQDLEEGISIDIAASLRVMVVAAAPELPVVPLRPPAGGAVGIGERARARVPLIAVYLAAAGDGTVLHVDGIMVLLIFDLLLRPVIRGTGAQRQQQDESQAQHPPHIQSPLTSDASDRAPSWSGRPRPGCPPTHR